MRKSNILVFQCQYKATTQSSLKVHIESVHEKVNYPCNQCEYKATQQSSLKTHIGSVHEKVKYPCHQCQYWEAMGAIKHFSKKSDFTCNIFNNKIPTYIHRDQ